MSKSEASFESVLVVPSWGDHPDDPDVAVEPGYSAALEEATFAIHRATDGSVTRTGLRGERDVDGVCVVVVLGKGDRPLTFEEHESLEQLVSDLREEKRISGRLKLRYEGGLSEWDEGPAPDHELPADLELPSNRDTTPPEVVEEDTADVEEDVPEGGPSKP